MSLSTGFALRVKAGVRETGSNLIQDPVTRSAAVTWKGISTSASRSKSLATSIILGWGQHASWRYHPRRWAVWRCSFCPALPLLRLVPWQIIQLVFEVADRGGVFNVGEGRIAGAIFRGSGLEGSGELSSSLIPLDLLSSFPRFFIHARHKRVAQLTSSPK